MLKQAAIKLSSQAEEIDYYKKLIEDYQEFVDSFPTTLLPAEIDPLIIETGKRNEELLRDSADKRAEIQKLKTQNKTCEKKLEELEALIKRELATSKSKLMQMTIHNNIHENNIKELKDLNATFKQNPTSSNKHLTTKATKSKTSPTPKPQRKPLLKTPDFPPIKTTLMCAPIQHPGRKALLPTPKPSTRHPPSLNSGSRPRRNGLLPTPHLHRQRAFPTPEFATQWPASHDYAPLPRQNTFLPAQNLHRGQTASHHSPITQHRITDNRIKYVEFQNSTLPNSPQFCTKCGLTSHRLSGCVFGYVKIVPRWQL